MLFDVLNKGEDITITYRGKAKAKLISTQKNIEKKEAFLSNILFFVIFIDLNFLNDYLTNE